MLSKFSKYWILRSIETNRNVENSFSNEMKYSERILAKILE